MCLEKAVTFNNQISVILIRNSMFGICDCSCTVYFKLSLPLSGIYTWHFIISCQMFEWAFIHYDPQ